MAGINLSGAIGMTGKRESVLADLPSIIQNTGDSVVKSMQDNKAKKERENALKLAKAQEDKAKEYGNITDYIVQQGQGITDNQNYGEAGKQAIQDWYNIYNDPKTSQAQKEQAKLDAKLKIEEASNWYKGHDEAVDKINELKASGIYDTTQAENILAGLGNAQDQEVMTSETMPPYNNRVPMEGAETKTTQIGAVAPIHKLPYEEAKKALGGKNPMDIVIENTKLIKHSPTDVAKNVLGDTYGDAWIKSNPVNGNDNFTVDTDQILRDKAKFVYSVQNGTNSASKAMKQAIESELFHESQKNLMHLSPAERKAWIDEHVPLVAAERYDDLANHKVAALTNDIAKHFSVAKPRGQSSILGVEKRDYTDPEKAPIVESTFKKSKIDELKASINETVEKNKTAGRAREKFEKGSDEWKNENQRIIANNAKLAEKKAELAKLGQAEIKVKSDYGVTAPTGIAKFNLSIPNVGVKNVDYKGLFEGSDGKDYLSYSYDTGSESDIVKDFIPYTRDVEKELADAKFFGAKVDYVKDIAEKQKIGDWRKDNVSSQPKKEESKDYGKRADGSAKGSGFLGEIKTKDGKVMTEKTTSIDFGLGEMNIPLIVSGLTKEEIDVLASGKKPTKEIVDKAVNHAKKRMSEGLSPYKNGGELKSKSGKKIKLNLKTNKYEYAE